MTRAACTEMKPIRPDAFKTGLLYVPVKGTNGCICIGVKNDTVHAAQTKLKKGPYCFYFHSVASSFVLGLPVHGTAQQRPYSLGSSHSGARLIHQRRESSLVMTEESGGANLAAFVSLKLLMMQSWERSTWSEIRPLWRGAHQTSTDTVMRWKSNADGFRF